MMRIHIFIIATLVIIVAAGSYWFVGHKAAQDAANMNPAAGGGLPVTALTIHGRTLDLYETLPGRTSAYKIAEIRPQVTGIITERLFEEGSLVKKGQQLYQIDPAPYQAAYNSTLATLKKAQANVKSVEAKAVRYTELVIVEAVSKQEYDDVVAALDQAHADVAVAQAAVADAKVSLDYTKVYAPIDGRIGKSNFTQGALVTAGQAQPMATITQLDPIYVDMTQSSNDLVQLRNINNNDTDHKLPVELTLDATGKTYPHKGTLEFSEVTVDETTGMVKLRAVMPNPDELLLPGLFVKANIKNDTMANALLVPQRATTRGPDGTLMVWVIGNDGTVNPRPVQTVKEIGDEWLLSGGLQDGETIAIDSFQKMQPGMPVTAVPAETDQPGTMGGQTPPEEIAPPPAVEEQPEMPPETGEEKTGETTPDSENTEDQPRAE